MSDAPLTLKEMMALPSVPDDGGPQFAGDLEQKITRKSAPSRKRALAELMARESPEEWTYKAARDAALGRYGGGDWELSRFGEPPERPDYSKRFGARFKGATFDEESFNKIERMYRMADEYRRQSTFSLSGMDERIQRMPDADRELFNHVQQDLAQYAPIDAGGIVGRVATSAARGARDVVRGAQQSIAAMMNPGPLKRYGEDSSMQYAGVSERQARKTEMLGEEGAKVETGNPFIDYPLHAVRAVPLVAGAVGAAVGGPAGEAAYWYSQTYPEYESRLIENGATEDQARFGATLSGLSTGAIFGGLGVASRFIPSPVSISVADSVGAYIKDVLKVGVGATAATEVVQNAINAGMAKLGENKELKYDIEKESGASLEKIRDSAIGVALLMLPKLALNIAVSTGERAELKRNLQDAVKEQEAEKPNGDVLTEQGKEVGQVEVPAEGGGKGIRESGQEEVGPAESLAGESAPGVNPSAPGPPPPPEQQAGPPPPPAERATFGDIPPDIFSLQHAVVDNNRRIRNASPLSKTLQGSDPDNWAAASAIMDANPNAGRAIIAELKARPRAFKDVVESFVVLQEQIQAKFGYDKALVEAERAMGRGDTKMVEAHKAQAEAYLDMLDDAERVSYTAGSYQGGAFRARRVVANADRTLGAMLVNAKLEKGKELTAEEKQQVAELHAKMEEQQREIVRLEELAARNAAEKHANDQNARAEKAVRARSRRKPVADAQVELENAWKDFTQKATGKLFSNVPDVELLASAAMLAKAYIKLNVVTFKEFIARVAERIGDVAAEKAKDVFKSAWSQARPVDLKNPGSLSRLANEIQDSVIAGGIHGRENVYAKVHEALQELIPDLSYEQARDITSRYGQFREPTKDEIKVERMQNNRESQEVAKLRDIAAGEIPKKTGSGRVPKTDEERRLEKQVHEAKKKAGIGVQETMRVRLENDIADLQKEIDTKEKIVKTRTPIVPDQLNARLIEVRDALKKQRDELFGKPELTEEQRLRMAISAAERSVNMWDKLLEDARKGIFGRPGRAKGPTNEALEALRAKRDAAKAEIQELYDIANPDAPPEVLEFSRKQTYYANRAARLEARLWLGDFAPDVKVKKYEIPEEMLTQKARYQSIDKQFKRLLADLKRKNRTRTQVALDSITETINTLRQMKSAGDISAIFRQGGWVGAGHPVMAAKNIKPSLKAFVSEEEMVRRQVARENRPNALSGLYKKAGLELTDPEGPLFRQEEGFIGEGIKKVPGLGAAVIGSERAYITYLNDLRADLFDSLVNTLGHAPSVEEAQIIANYVNVATGRGNPYSFKSGMTAASKILFAPRYTLGRFQLLLGQPLFHKPGAGTWAVRRLIAAEYARSLSGIATMYITTAAALNAMYGPPGQDDPDKNWSISFDPRSSDFGKIRLGDTRIDPLMGLSQTSVFLYRTISGQTKTVSGEIRNLYGDLPYGYSDWLDVAKDFARGKLAPIFGTLVNMRLGKKMGGDPFTWGDVARDVALPMAWNDIYEAMRKDGWSRSSALSMLSILGLGIQTYKAKREKQPLQ